MERERTASGLPTHAILLAGERTKRIRSVGLRSLILVTGAGGKTGRLVVQRMAEEGHLVRALVHRPEQRERLVGLGARETLTADMTRPEDLAKAVKSAGAVYHICPNVHPGEVEIGEAMISAALEAGVERFVFHSVLRPDVEDMPHHWLKYAVEQELMASGLAYTIVRPCAYMQNLAAQLPRVRDHGRLEVPYDVDAGFSVVDLRDVARVAARVLSEPGHEGRVYELCGPESVSSRRMARTLQTAVGRPVEAVAVDPSDWEREALAAGLKEYAIAALLAMFRWYDRHGLVGSPADLERLLDGPAGSFGDFVRGALVGQA